MIIVWRGWGLLALVALFPLLASCAGLSDVEPRWVFPAACAVALTLGGTACVYYGTRWNRPVTEHSLYFVPLQVWGWIYLALVALPSLVFALAGSPSSRA